MEEKVQLKSWTLVAFAKTFGPALRIKSMSNAGGEEWSSLRFTDAIGVETWVNFSNATGVLTAQQIVAKKDTLRVIQRESGAYYLYEESGEEVDLGL